MATLGVVSYAVTPHSKMQILQQSTASNTMSHGSERREIIILRKKPKLPLPSVETKPPPPPPPPPQLQQLAVPQTQPAPGSLPPTVPPPPLPPATVQGSNVARGRKRPSPGTRGQHQPPPNAVARRNARERNRVKQVNNGFATLREHIPASISSAYASGADAGRGGSKKLSKVETLRMAVDYIRSLQRLLEMDENDPANASHSSADSFPSPADRRAYGSSPRVLVDDDDDDEDTMSPGSPRFGRGDGHLAQLVSPDVDAYPADAPHLYEVDENMAPHRNLLVPAHLVDLYGQPSPGELAALPVEPASRLPHPAASLSPGVYSEQSASPVGPQDGGVPDDVPSPVGYLPAYKATTQLQCPAPSVAAYVHQGFQSLEVIGKRVSGPGEEGAGQDMMDIMTWWEHEERLRQAPNSS